MVENIDPLLEKVEKQAQEGVLNSEDVLELISQMREALDFDYFTIAQFVAMDLKEKKISSKFSEDMDGKPELVFPTASEAKRAVRRASKMGYAEWLFGVESQ